MLRVNGGSGEQISVPRATRLRIKQTSDFAGDAIFLKSVVPHSKSPLFLTQRLESRYFTPQTSLI